ncbi:MAG TPA: dienelactone hydrolase family protein [Candidatus Elarobacter sp.]|jgi:carboxymethylenebutenolidase|nr:dienelactone hydrolase family protein [Candidatus Elarobacter sp.]
MQQHTSSPIARAEFVETGAGKRAFYAVPAGGGPFPGVLLFQEAFGVNDYVQSEVKRLAEHGYAAIAPDLFGGKTFDYNDRESIFARLKSLNDDGMLDHVRASAVFLGAQPEVKKGAYGAVGFCMGGRLAVLTAIELGDRIAAASSFYGGGIAPKEPRFWPVLTGRLAEVKAELLLLYGADDESIDAAEHGRIAETLSAAKKRYTLGVYPGAGHAFASRDRESYDRDVAENAWSRTLTMFDRTLR